MRALDGIGPDEHFGEDGDFSDGEDYEIWDIAEDDSLVGYMPEVQHESERGDCRVGGY